MKEILLIKNGEIALKGLNRGVFEDALIGNIKRRLAPLGKCRIRKAQSTIYVEPQDENYDIDEASSRLSTVFGIAAFSRACVVEKEFSAISAAAPIYLRETLENVSTFKVEAKRSDKSFPMTSPELSAELGGILLDAFPHLKVDVNHPETVVRVEVRDFAAYLYAGKHEGAGGMPVGTSGKAALLISGGIDSPVAAYMMAKRGIALSAVHFASPPYTSLRAKQKVIELLEAVSPYCGSMTLFIVPFTEIQEAIRDHCPEELFTIIMRRFMMRLSERIAQRQQCLALVTGESVAQVASQTLQAIGITNEVCKMPVLRPVIGMDKQEIVEIARKIGTFEISIQPYEDCCTVFTPKHPRTRPKLEIVCKAEQALDIDGLIERALVGVEEENIHRK